VLTPEMLGTVFGVEAEVRVHPITQKPHILFYSAAMAAGSRVSS
jgi:ABC-type hemin transport system ATPase subunit